MPSWAAEVAEIPAPAERAASSTAAFEPNYFKMSDPHLASGMRFQTGEEVKKMFRVFYTDSTQGQRWTLCGRLAGPWVEELRSYWRYVRDRAACAPAVVDLSEITFVDDAGEKLLAEMQSAGSKFVASGVENKYLLDSLKSGKPNGGDK